MNHTNDFVFCPYDDHSSPQLLSTFSTSPSFNGILKNPNSRPSHHHHHDDHHHHHLLHSSPSDQFEFDPESLYAVILQPHNDHDHDENDDGHHQQHHPCLLPTVEDQSLETSETITSMEDSKKIPKASRKRTSKTDRHSKIYTAKGPRDRRMRLSLEVARDFFGLQDMLGFDKASKTVGWLLTQANPEIKKLAMSLPQKPLNHGLSSEEPTASGWLGEGGSKINAGTNNASADLIDEVVSASTNEINGKSGKEKKRRSQSRNPVFTKLPKDARTKARERAKERTKEKMMMRLRSSSEAVVCMNSNWTSFETGEDSVQEMEEPSPTNGFVDCNNMVMNHEDDMAQEESLDIINKWCPFSIFNYHQNHEPASSMENHYTDLHQFLAKPS